MSLEERNKAYKEFAASKKCRRAMKKQCRQQPIRGCQYMQASIVPSAPAPQAFYYPPNVENATVQREVQEQPVSGAPDKENVIDP